MGHSRNRQHLLLSVAYRDVERRVALEDLIGVAVVWCTSIVSPYDRFGINVDT